MITLFSFTKKEIKCYLATQMPRTSGGIIVSAILMKCKNDHCQPGASTERKRDFTIKSKFSGSKRLAKKTNLYENFRNIKQAFIRRYEFVNQTGARKQIHGEA